MPSLVTPMHFPTELLTPLIELWFAGIFVNAELAHAEPRPLPPFQTSLPL